MRRIPSGRRRARHALATAAGTLALLGVVAAVAGAGTASAAVVPSGGDFQSVPPTWTASALTGTLNTVSASQASSGANRFYRTQYTTPANLLGAGLAGMAASEGITSPSFTWGQSSPAALTASYDFGASFSGLLGADAGAGIGMYLQNVTTGAETLLASNRVTRSSPDFSTISATADPSLLVSGDTYRVQVRETFSPTVQVAGGATVDLDNVTLTETPATPVAPTLTTSASIGSVTSSSAVASATIDPGSAATTVTVHYGTTASYTSAVSQTLAANSGPTQVRIPISGLTAATGYHAEVTATNGGGTVSSPDLTFTTAASAPSIPPPAIGTSSAQGIDEHDATLGTTIDDDGAGSSYEVQYGTTSGYGSSTSPQTLPSGANGATAVTVPVSGLVAGTTYHARFVATSQGGTTDGADFTFTTAAPSPPAFGSPPPSATTTSTDGTQETVSAAVNPGTNDTQVSVSYGPTSSYSTTTASQLIPAGSGTTTVSFPISGLTPGNMYHYQVTATNADGTVDSSDEMFVPTAQTSPPIGATSTAGAPGETAATLDSTIDTGGNGGTYDLQYGTSSSYASQTATQSLTPTNGNQALSAALSGLQPATTYHVRFVAMVNGYATSVGSDDTFTTAAASPPTVSNAAAATSDSAGDQETVSADVDPGSHDTQVSVSYGTTSSYGSTSSSTTVTANGGSTPVSIAISGLTPGTTYHYQVSATNSDGTVHTTDATFTPTASTAPAVGPTTATSGPGETTVTLGSSVDSAGSGGTYEVRYGTGQSYGTQSAPQTLTATAGSQPLSVSLTGLAPGTTYHVQFVVNVTGHPTSYGSDDSFTTTAAPTFTAGPTHASNGDGTTETIGATVDPGGLQTTVSVSYGTSSAYGSTDSTTGMISAVAGATAVSIPITGLTAGTTYHYQLSAVNADGTTTTSDDTFTPMSQSAPPVGTPTSGNPGPSSVAVDSNVDTGGGGGTWYVEYGATTGYGSQTTTRDLTQTGASQPLAATLTGLAPGTTYHLRFDVFVAGHPTSHSQDETITTAPGIGAYAFTDDAPQSVSAQITVQPGSHDTTVYAVYGTTTGYGSQTRTITVPAGSGSTVVTLPLAGLTAGTTYHLQYVVTGSGTTVRSADQTFTTGAAATGGAGTTTTTTATTTTGTTTTTAPTPTHGPAAGPSCLAAYVSGSTRALKLLSVPAGAQLTARRSLRVAITRRVAMAGTPTFQLSGGRRTAIRRRAFTIALRQLHGGQATRVRVVIPRGHHRRAMTLRLRIDALACGIQLSAGRTGSAALLTLRMPLGARRVRLTLPARMAAPRTIALLSPTGTRSLALTGSGAALHLRRRAGSLRVSLRGSTLTVSGLTRTTTGMVLRLARTRTRGTVTARVTEPSGATQTVRVALRRSR